VPILGICFGHQLIGIAAGGKAVKMKFGHHGINHPVYDLKKKRVYITSQNHNFMIDKSTLPEELEITHISLFDGSIQGFRLKQYPVTSFQGHPEGSPGPQDIDYLFDEFMDQVYLKADFRSLSCH
jgi:carbamoyl-phosphate synthase small subunit